QKKQFGELFFQAVSPKAGRLASGYGIRPYEVTDSRGRLSLQLQDASIQALLSFLRERYCAFADASLRSSMTAKADATEESAGLFACG
ncbi:MAG: hypothetical protein IIV03_01005, partial [Clostridia bacterium]|nr:hypothetical protein [Clostridia bacterium]